MSLIREQLFADLRNEIVQLGKDGGQVGPSIYDTAQALRFAPPAEGAAPGLEWLASHQHADGGWGDPAVPIARGAATLAAVLALDTHGAQASDRRAVAAGLEFIHSQAELWDRPVPIDIPLAAELLFPMLIDQARARGLAIDDAPYQRLRKLGDQRRQLLTKVALQPATPLVHSWEAWGKQPDPRLLDGAGSIGHSPAATAAWLHAAGDRPELADACQAARCYLARAAAATGTGVPGVVCTVFPYPRNEQIVSLFTILLAGLLDHQALSDVIHSQVAGLWAGLRPTGYGISDLFSTDGDLTAMSFAVLAQAGYRPPVAVLRQYIADGSCLTYRHELQRSFSATTHAAHAFALFGGNPVPLLDGLCNQRSDGRWLGDKWHASWLYLTSHLTHALLAAQRPADALPVIPALINQQRPDGSWGVTSATREETAYGALALLAFDQRGLLPESGRQSLRQATRFLVTHYQSQAEDSGASWSAKDLYRPRRIARIEETCATLACVLADPAWQSA